MYKLTIAIFAIFTSQSAYASCTKLVENHKYLLKEGVEYCLESNSDQVLLEVSGTADMIEVSDKDKTIFEIMYPEEQIIIEGEFILTGLKDMHLSYAHGFIYIENAPKRRVRRNLGNATKGVAGTVVGSRLAGDDSSIAPDIIGGAFGVAAGMISGPAGPFVGSAVGTYIATDIRRNGKNRRPLTRINTNRGLSTSGMRAYSGSRGGSCYAGCHS